MKHLQTTMAIILLFWFNNIVSLQSFRPLLFYWMIQEYDWLKTSGFTSLFRSKTLHNSALLNGYQLPPYLHASASFRPFPLPNSNFMWRIVTWGLWFCYVVLFWWCFWRNKTSFCAGLMIIASYYLAVVNIRVHMNGSNYCHYFARWSVTVVPRLAITNKFIFGIKSPGGKFQIF